MNNKQPVIAHINDAFFQLTETFIYHSISGLKHYHPHCLGWKFLNPHNFVFPKEQKHTISAGWPLFGSLYGYITKRFFEMDPVAEKKAETILKKLDPDLIHAHFGFNGYFALSLKKRLNIPMVTTFYGMDMSLLPERSRWKKRYLSLFQNCDLFLVEGPNMRSSLVNLGCPEQRIKIQRIAIPVRSIRFKARMPKKNREKIIMLFAGRFVEKKGLLYALKALNRVKVSHKNFEFRIIGDGSLKQMLLRFVQDHSMQDNISMLGNLAYPDYLKEMENADIFLQPSIKAANGDSEGGAPTTLLEAQAQGLPVISTNHADIPYVVVPDKSALLSSEKDWESMAQNIIYLIEHQEKWRDMGLAGRKHIESFHDIDKEIELLEEKYDHLLEEHAGKSSQ